MYNKDNPEDVRNCRSVTVLNAVGKIFEQLLSKQLTNFMEPRLNDNLSAYRKKNRCETSLVQLVEEWKMSLDNKEYEPPTTEDSSSRRIMRLVPVFILETNNECLPKFVQTDNASSSVKTAARQLEEKLSGFKSGHYGLFTAIGVVLKKKD